MAGDYTIEPLSDGIFDELGPLMLDAFGHTGDRAYFDWKYRQNPAGPAIGNIARSRSGEIAAFYGMIPEICAYREKRCRIYQSCDTMTHSHHRRRGLFRLLAEQTYAEGKNADPGFFAYGFGGPTSTPGFLKMGWKIEQQLPLLFLPFPLSLLPGRGGKVERTNKLGARLLEMMAQAQPRSGPSVYRDEAFLRWRLNNPRRNYEYFETSGAYAVFTRMDRFLLVIDFWEQNRSSGRSVALALRRASIDARLKGLLTLAAAQSQFAHSLKAHGFLRNPFRRGPAAGTTPFITYGVDPLQPGDVSWAVNSLDHDSY